MTRYKKKMFTQQCIKGMYSWFANQQYAYNHNFDSEKLYGFMYRTYHLSWHKTQRLFFKNIPKNFRDEISY